ncbi:venom serine carboxypeptidase-like [Arctopsyche grandis]|uniref:venom serine carboxypeptidase-like n=1 Tax=Arctopsyche grandis TaxID=121162 RepID=UPI00406D6B3F
MEDLTASTPSHAGYITVDKGHNSNLWFWYFPVEQYDIKKAPLIIWLQGGPGASSLFGLFDELGPFSVDKDENLIENPHSWHKENSLLFIDNPVGTGFSFTESDEGYATNQTIIGEQLYTFIVQFLQIFPELQEVPLYIAGESYAGKHIPSFAYVIHKNNPTADIKVNLKGLAIGNGFIDPETMMDYSSYVYQLGLVDDNQAADMRYFENETRVALANKNYTGAYDYFSATLGTYLWRSRIFNLYNYVYEKPIDISGAYSEFIQKPEVRKALHVGNTEFTSIGKVYKKLQSDFMTSGKAWLEELLEHYKVMVYSGQMDIIVAYPLSVKTYRSLKWSGSDEYLKASRTPWYENNTVIGYTKKAGNFFEVFIRNAGHMVPTDQPRRSSLLINSFINDVEFQSKPSKDSKEE